MIRTGLLSVTFRQLVVEDIIPLVVQAGLDGIEWGGDIHVPHGEVKRAEVVGRLTRDAGLQVVSYGSYYRVGVDAAEQSPFQTVLETALALGAPSIRVWAGNRGSADADAAWWSRVTDDFLVIAEAAKQAGITIGVEYHGGTLTDTSASAVRLFHELHQAHPQIHVASLWQPSVNVSAEDRLSRLRDISPWLSHLHVFHWHDGIRLPLSLGESEWMPYLGWCAQLPGERYAMLEFVRDNSPEQFLADAATLKAWINRISK
jgi:sugar phosphate isomerase/epimerase